MIPDQVNCPKCGREVSARRAGLDSFRRQRLEVVEHPGKKSRTCAGSGRVLTVKLTVPR